ncbi:elongation of very long chain fatty acids protein [Plakobranchus ocellatus]|uniref:Elongation of very long chain fatty acids protein n=1 Tax=Plakobranchus ocellatus TaxID=259542 RepID=A0AAV4D9N5_9GAST|nr:elongation of very long chain fatty acids protein [Plakobranchus ocellatus]
MSSLSLKALQDLYDSTMAQADPRCDGYPLLDSPHKMLVMVGLYLLVIWLGPKVMANRKPWDLRRTIVIYNFALVLLSFSTFLWTCAAIIKVGGYSIYCDSIDKYQSEKDKEEFINIGYIFFLSKLIEFWDTIFFVLRKKNRQITFLHVYHHATMTVFTWLGVKFLPGSSNIVYPLINSFIHAVMYTYYGLSACGPGMAKYLWWKKYLTRMQISQFVIFLGQGFINYYYDCPLPKVFAYAVYFYTFTILLLFINFYVKAYRAKQGKGVDNNKYHQNGVTGSAITNGKTSVNGNTTSNGKAASNGTFMANGDSKKVL